LYYEVLLLAVFVAAAAAAAAVVGVGMGSKPYLLLPAGGRRFSHSAQVYAIAFATTRLEELQHDVSIDVVDGGHRHGRDVVVRGCWLWWCLLPAMMVCVVAEGRR